MKIRIIGALLFFMSFNINSYAQGFATSSLQWDIPTLGGYEYMVSYTYHNVIDFNGDGKPDLIDSADQTTGDTFLNGTQKYWKVYLNTGSGYSPTAIQWNIPSLGGYEYMVSYTYHNVIDFNGDGKPDLIDSADQITGDTFLNGGQKYWKVYLNTGSGFSASALEWNIPSLGGYEYMVSYNYHRVIDFNGDGKPDLIDSADETTGNTFLNGGQKYWKVYLNTGVGFSPSALEWNIPSLGGYEYLVSYNYHNVIDFNGDGKPDLIDSADETTGDVFLNVGQKYWKVYLNTGVGFSPLNIQWNIPSLGGYEYMVSYNYHSVIDFNGDGKPDLIDSADQITGDVFLNGGQKYWKVYLNTELGFSPAPLQWNIPALGGYEYMVSYNDHRVIDINGDRKLDLIDSADEITGDVFLNGGQKYWKVYLNNSPDLSNSNFGSQETSIYAYPNPIRDVLSISSEKQITAVALYNLLGQEVLSKSINAMEGSFDVSNLSSGTYFVRVAVDHMVTTLKLIKE